LDGEKAEEHPKSSKAGLDRLRIHDSRRWFTLPSQRLAVPLDELLDESKITFDPFSIGHHRQNSINNFIQLSFQRAT